jgi:hypothetical protein
MPWRAGHIGLLLSMFIAACGGSSSRDRHDGQRPNGAGGDAEDPRGAGADTQTGGTTTGAASGAASGGTSGGSDTDNLGGMDAGPQAPELPLPPGCEARARTETADTCSLAVLCETASRLTDCRRLDSGRWQCRCQPLNQDRIYQVENAPGLEACAVAANLCSENELVLGDESCDATADTSGQDSCDLELACGSPIELDLAADARAWLMRFGSASCKRTEWNDSFECSCSHGYMATDYDLFVDSGAPSCRPLLDFCMSHTSTKFDGEEECLPTKAVSSSEGCERSEACAVPMPLNDEVIVAELEARYAGCEPRVGGGSECYCSTSSSTFNFRNAEAPDDSTCESSILNCDPDAVIEATGSASCELTDLYAGNVNGCDADLTCFQDAVVDEREIVAQGRVRVYCARSDQGTNWWCSCASGKQTARFALGVPEADASQACNQAPARCLEDLTVHLGPSDGGVDPPDPLP